MNKLFYIRENINETNSTIIEEILISLIMVNNKELIKFENQLRLEFQNY